MDLTSAFNYILYEPAKLVKNPISDFIQQNNTFIAE